MKRKIILGIIAGILLVSLVFAGLSVSDKLSDRNDKIREDPKQDTIINSDLSQTIDIWVKNNVNDRTWEEDLPSINENNTFFGIYSYNYSGIVMPVKYVLIKDYESLRYCTNYQEGDCIEYYEECIINDGLKCLEYAEPVCILKDKPSCIGEWVLPDFRQTIIDAEEKIDKKEMTKLFNSVHREESGKIGFGETKFT